MKFLLVFFFLIQGHLITSHLFEEHQRDVNLFLHSHELLSLSSRQEVNQVFVWHELKFNQDAVTSVPVGYRPCVTRNFLMVIGLVRFSRFFFIFNNVIAKLKFLNLIPCVLLLRFLRVAFLLD